MISSHIRLAVCVSLCALTDVSATPPAFAQRADTTIERILRERVESGRSAGIVLGIIDSTGIHRVMSWNRSELIARLDENSVFEIGSITKVFTGILLADMTGRGQVTLDTPAKTYLPIHVRIPEGNGREINLVDLATHSSALPNSRGNHRPANPMNPYADYAVQDMYDFLGNVQLQRDIGSGYEYSNFGAAVLGHILENRADVRFADLLRERIFEPLEMKDTGIELTHRMAERLVPGHDASLNPTPNWDFAAFAPAGALRSNMNDMLKFLAANLRPVAGPLGAAISDSHRARFRINEYAGVALGWHHLTVEGDTVIWHPGETGGYHSFIGFNPVKKLGVIILSNSRTSIDDIGFHLLMKESPLEPVAVHIATRNEVTLAPEELEQFVGVYEFDPDTQLDVVVESGKLFGIHKFGKVQLHAESNNAFFLFESDTQIRFERDQHGNINGLVEFESGKESRAVKVR